MTVRGQHIELFAGTGAASIPLSKLGFETIAWAENEPFCQSILRTRFPGAAQFSDVGDLTAHDLDMARPKGREGPLLLSGGFPCPDISAIGRNAGMRPGTRSGLWTEFARLIEDFRPEYVVIENVSALRVRGLDTVLTDLDDLSYNARWDTIPAAAAGAAHRRARLFIVACPQYGPRLGDPSETFATSHPRAAGSMVGGRVEALPREFAGPYPGLRYPTPRHAANEWRTTRNAPSHGNGHGKTLAGEANDLERARGAPLGKTSESCGNVSPNWVEWIMGLPEDWTDPNVPNEFLEPHRGWAAEPLPRTETGVRDRRGRLMALGNGLVPQQFALALRMLTQLSPAAVA